MKNAVQAFIFDLDGVITDTAEFHYIAWKKLADSLNIPLDREFNEELKGISRMESLEKILIHGKKEKDYTDVQKEALAYRKNEYYKELIKEITPKHILPGIQELLEDIKANNKKIGLASASKNATTILNSLGLTEFFDYIVDAGTVKNGKPDPEIFIKAANNLHVAPENCIGIEDAVSGVEAIKAASMYAVGVGDRDVLKRADVIVNITEELDYIRIVNSYKKFRKEFDVFE